MLPPNSRQTGLDGHAQGCKTAGDFAGWAASHGGVLDCRVPQGFTNLFGSLIGVELNRYAVGF